MTGGRREGEKHVYLHSKGTLLPDSEGYLVVKRGGTRGKSKWKEEWPKNKHKLYQIQGEGSYRRPHNLSPNIKPPHTLHSNRNPLFGPLASPKLISLIRSTEPINQ